MKYLGLFLALAIGIPLGFTFIHLGHPMFAVLTGGLLGLSCGLMDGQATR